MSSKKKIFSKIFIGILFVLVVLSTNIFAIVKPTSNFYVNDYANLLSSETENYIMNINQSLNSKTKAQVVVVTVQNLEGSSLEEYATELFRNFGIGDKKLNNGVLMLIALEERQSRIEVGYGLEGILNDAKTGRIQDEYMIPYLRQNNWDEGIKNGFSAIINEIEKAYGVSVGSETANVVQNLDIENAVNTFELILTGSIIATIFIRIFSSKRTNKSIIRIIYLILLAIISFIIIKDIVTIIIILIFNLVALFSRASSRTDTLVEEVFHHEVEVFLAEDFLEAEVHQVVDGSSRSF